MNKISLNDYEIIFDDSLESVKDFMSAANYSSVFILVDENTKQHCLPVLGKVISSYTVIETKSGETSNEKNCAQENVAKNSDKKNNGALNKDNKEKADDRKNKSLNSNEKIYRRFKRHG